MKTVFRMGGAAEDSRQEGWLDMVADPFGTDSDKPVVLAEAAEEALEGFGGEETQLAVIPACKVKFVGMSWDSLDEVPALRQEMTFIVKAIVVGHGTEVMRNGEVRETAKMLVQQVRVHDE